MQIGLVTTNTKQTNKGGWGDATTPITHTKYTQFLAKHTVEHIVQHNTWYQVATDLLFLVYFCFITVFPVLHTWFGK